MPPHTAGGGAKSLDRPDDRAGRPAFSGAILPPITHTNSGTYADAVITTAGQINIIGPRPPMVTDLSFVSLEGISYQA